MQRIATSPATNNDLDPTKAIYDLNHELYRSVNQSSVVTSLEVAKKIKSAKDVQPNRVTYLLLMRVLVANGYFREATELFNELADRDDCQPDTDVCNEMLKARIYNGEDPYDVLRYMAASDIPSNSITSELLTTRAVAGEQVEWAILSMLSGESVHPSSAKAGERTARLAADLGEVRLAIDVLHQVDQTGASALPETVLHILRAAAAHQNACCVKQLWDRAVRQHDYLLDEGTCLDVLHTAAMQADIDLAHDALHMLQITGVALKEQHLTPVFDAYLRAGNMENALAFLPTMRNLGGDEALSTTGVVTSIERVLLRPSSSKIEIASDEPTTTPSPWMNHAEPLDRINALYHLAGRVGPVHQCVHTALVRSACKVMDVALARQMLWNPAYLLGSGNYPSPEAFAAAAHLALDGDFAGLAKQILKQAENAGLDNADPWLFEANFRLSLTNVALEDNAFRRSELLSDAIDSFDELKDLEVAGVPSTDAYLWLIEALAEHRDPRLEAITLDMIRGHHRLPRAVYKGWDPALVLRIDQHLDAYHGRPGMWKKRLADEMQSE